MADSTYQKKAKIVYNRRIVSGYYRLAFNLSEIARAACPGQFIMLRVSQGYKPFLRRPFSIHRLVYNSASITHSQRKNLKPNGIEILYQVVGKGTELLSEQKPGQYIDILGPLGNGFNYQLPITNYQLPILVGGGMGIAPLLFLAQQLSTVNCRLSTVLIGAKTKKEILSKKEFASLGLNVKISTNDGSAGFKGEVTDLLKQQLSTVDCSRMRFLKGVNLRDPEAIQKKSLHSGELSTIYACGPKPMLAQIATISKQYNIAAQVSLDEYMACGLGVCLGCMIKTKTGYQAVCKEGPVFNPAEIIWKGRD